MGGRRERGGRSGREERVRGEEWEGGERRGEEWEGGESEGGGVGGRRERGGRGGREGERL